VDPTDTIRPPAAVTVPRRIGDASIGRTQSATTLLGTALRTALACPMATVVKDEGCFDRPWKMTPGEAGQENAGTLAKL